MIAAAATPVLATTPPTIAGRASTVEGCAGGVMNLRIALGGEPLAALARALVKLEGVRVTIAGDGAGRGRCYLVSCLGFKMVLSSPTEDAGHDVALALVSRVPHPPVAVLSELAGVLDRLMSESSRPPASVGSAFRGRAAGEKVEENVEEDVDHGSVVGAPASSLRRSALRPGQPLARKTPLRRKTPLARTPFRRS